MILRLTTDLQYDQDFVLGAINGGLLLGVYIIAKIAISYGVALHFGETPHRERKHQSPPPPNSTPDLSE